MDLEHAIRNALDGEATLIVGAGFSVGAKDSDGVSLPTGAGLAAEIAKGLDVATTTTDLGILADMYKKTHGEHGLLALLKRRLIVRDVSPAQQQIARLPWRRAYTMNYDGVLELAARIDGSKFASLTFADDPSKVPANSKICLHCNGSIDRVDIKTLDENLILTNSSYMADAFNRTKWARLLREDLQVARSVFIVGYSLYDLDISRIIAAAPDILRKTFFVVEEEAPADIVFSLGRFGTVEQIGIEKFASSITEITKSHITSTPEHLFSSFYQHRASPSQVAPVDDKAVYDLFVRGEFRRDFLPSSYASTLPSYFLRREVIDRIVSNLNTGSRAIAVHSYLGNGKTLVTQGVAFRARQDGYSVFEFEREKPGFERECDLICRATQKTLVIIEEYNRNFGVIERLRIIGNPNVRLLLTARTPAHIMEWARLRTALGGVEPDEISVDALSPNEIATLDELLSRHGLLGKEAGRSADSRIYKFKKDFSSELRGILLWLLDSEHIRNRIAATFRSLSESNTVARLVVAALTLRALGGATDSGLLAELVGVDRFNEAALARNPLVAEFVLVNQQMVVTRSTLFSVTVLRLLWPEGYVLPVITDMIETALRNRYEDRQMAYVGREMMRYSRVEQFVPAKDRRDHLISYYEAIKNFSGCASNEFFWLQYAIARISTGDYELANRYLDTAYGIVKSRSGFDTYQLDNTRARLILLRTIELLPDDVGIGAFREAHRILSKQMRESGHGFYPFRVAILYAEFWDKIAKNWGVAQQAIIFEAVRFVLKRAQSVDPMIAVHADVRRCIDVLQKVISHDKRSTMVVERSR